MNEHSALECVFCRELAGRRDTNFAHRYPECRSRIIAATHSLAAFPCIGQLAPGHFLVVTQQHHRTLAEAHECIPAVALEFLEIVNRVHELLDADSGAALVFEHGAFEPRDGGCGIYHAHMHVIPRVGFLNLRNAFVGFGLSDFSSISEALRAIAPDAPYILFGSHEHRYAASGLQGALPSQYMRMVVARELGNSAWDWREYKREAGLLHTLRAAGLPFSESPRP